MVVGRHPALETALEVRRPVAPTAIAPTIARLLRIQAPSAAAEPTLSEIP